MDLAYQILKGCVYQSSNPLISNGLDGFAYEQWHPFQASKVSNAAYSVTTSHVSVSVTPREVTAHIAHRYLDDYYNRIHLVPSDLDFGNIASEQQVNIAVWNAFLTAKELLEIGGINDDIELSGPETPLDISALKEVYWQLSVPQSGAISIDQNLTWQFAENTLILHVKGNRIVPFGFLVDWSKPVIEHLNFLTDVLQSETGHEQRRALRFAPRLSFDAEFLLTGTERQYFDLSVVGWGDKTFALPIWPQQQWLNQEHSASSYIIYCDTTGRNFRADRLAMIRLDNSFDNETVEIESVLADRLILKRPLVRTWPEGSCLSPAVTAQLEAQPNVTKRTDTMMRTNCSFKVTESIDHTALLPLEKYRGYPIFNELPNEKTDLTHSYERLIKAIDNQTGRAAQFDQAKVAFSLFQYEWMTYGRVAQEKFRAFIYGLQGRQKAVWLPTFSQDLTVKGPLMTNTNMFQIEWCGYSRFGIGQLGRQDIQISLRNGQKLYRRIVAAGEIDTRTEFVEVDSSFAQQITPTDILSISFLSLCRLNTDSISIQHINDSDGIAKSSATFRGVRES